MDLKLLPAPPAPRVVNHWGVWVVSDQPTTGVTQINHAPSWVFDETYNGINLACKGCTIKRRKNGCEFCENSGPYLIGSWKKYRGQYSPDKKGDYSAIVREEVIQVVHSKTLTPGVLCSPCYPGQVDLDTPGEFLGYALPRD